MACGESGHRIAPDRPEPRQPERADASPSRHDEDLQFEGITQAVAGDDFVYLSWNPAQSRGDTKVHYRVYADTRHDVPELMAVMLETEPGVTSCLVNDLAPGETVQFLVRAVQSNGAVDHNRVVLRATPNPVRYLRADGEESGDGRSPETPYRSTVEAMQELLGRTGLNLYVAGPLMRERILLFEGMAVYGGFQDDFSFSNRRPWRQPTRWETADESDLVRVAPGKRWSVLDGVELVGADLAGRGIVADDCRLQLNAVTIHGFRRMGVHVRGEEDSYSMARVRVHRSIVRNNGAEGISVQGIADLQVVGSTLRDNQQEGLEAKPLSPGTGRAAVVLVDRCELRGNGDAGVDLDVQLLEPALKNPGPVRIAVRDSVFQANEGTGLTIDLQIEKRDGIELSVAVQDNRITRSGGAGVHLDLDAPGRLSFQGNTVEGNGRDGLQLTGDDATSLLIVEANGIVANQGADRSFEAAATVLSSSDAKARSSFPATRWPYPVSVSPPPSLALAGDHVELSFVPGSDRPAIRWQRNGAAMMSTMHRTDHLVTLTIPPEASPGDILELQLVPAIGAEKQLSYEIGWPLRPGSESEVRLPAATSAELPATQRHSFELPPLEPSVDVSLVALTPGSLELTIGTGAQAQTAQGSEGQLVRHRLAGGDDSSTRIEVYNPGSRSCRYLLSVQERQP